MADNDGIYGLAKKVVPPRARFYTQTLLGDRTKPFTQDDLTTDELRHIHAAVEASRERLQDRIERIKNAESYSDISMSGIYPKHIENNPDLMGEYNVLKFLDSLNKKILPLLVAFHPNVRDDILVMNPEKIKLFTPTELELCNNMPIHPEDKDDLEEFFTIDPRETVFWEQFNYNPDIWNNEQFEFYVPDYAKNRPSESAVSVC